MAEYLISRLKGEDLQPQQFLDRVFRSASGKKFIDPNKPEFPYEYLRLSLLLDPFPFAMAAERQGVLLIAKKIPSSSLATATLFPREKATQRKLAFYISTNGRNALPFRNSIKIFCFGREGYEFVYFVNF